jgi:peptidoglycan/xylan/chitin deacetylase (PgdA/CDA1 family)
MISIAGVPLSYAVVGPLAAAFGVDATLIGAGLAGAAGVYEVETQRKSDRAVDTLAAAATEANRSRHVGQAQVVVHWSATTDKPLVALTFDDGPRPEWTPMVLDTLDRYDVPATFFVVGQRLRAYASLLRGRIARHEVANHTWDHADLAQRSPAQAYDEMSRAHDVIVAATGKAPTLVRPPYGHLVGSTLMAAARLNYQVVLWSLQMVESRFPNDPAGLARYIQQRIVPGTILLAHDTGTTDRLVALRGLPDLITGLRERGYEFRTVSDLLAEVPQQAT